MDTNNVASILGWTPEEAQSALDELGASFMQPDVDYITEAMAVGCDGTDEFLAGFYSRLSAPGYLDCTDWSGPFESEDEAYADLISLYAEWR